MPAALASESDSRSPEGPYLPKTSAARPEATEAVPELVRVLTVVGAVSVRAPARRALKLAPIVFSRRKVSLTASRARTRPVDESTVRKPAPAPVAVSATRMSPRTDMVGVPFAPPPCVPEKFGLVTETLARPAPGKRLTPATTREPVGEAAESTPAARVRDCEASGRSSRRPPPLSTDRKAKFSVVEAVAEPRTERTPPWMLTVPPRAAPRRLFRLSTALSSSRVPPALTLKTLLAAFVETKAEPFAPE